MATAHQYRLILTVPAARIAAFNTWVRANLDAGAADWFRPTLSNGAAGWCNAALTAAQAKLVMQRLCTLASIAQPAAWDGWTRAQRRQWFLDQRVAIRTATGIRVLAADNEGIWDSPEAELAAAGLMVTGG